MPFIRVSKRYAVNTDQISHVEYIEAGRLSLHVKDREIAVDKEKISAVCDDLGIEPPDKGEPDDKAHGESGVVG